MPEQHARFTHSSNAHLDPSSVASTRIGSKRAARRAGMIDPTGEQTYYLSRGWRREETAKPGQRPGGLAVVGLESG